HYSAASALSPLSLHDALPILPHFAGAFVLRAPNVYGDSLRFGRGGERTADFELYTAAGDRRVRSDERKLVYIQHGIRRGGNGGEDRKSTRLNSSHVSISYAVF